MKERTLRWWSPYTTSWEKQKTCVTLWHGCMGRMSNNVLTYEVRFYSRIVDMELISSVQKQKIHMMLERHLLMTKKPMTMPLLVEDSDVKTEVITTNNDQEMEIAHHSTTKEL